MLLTVSRDPQYPVPTITIVVFPRAYSNYVSCNRVEVGTGPVKVLQQKDNKDTRVVRYDEEAEFNPVLFIISTLSLNLCPN